MKDTKLCKAKYSDKVALALKNLNKIASVDMGSSTLLKGAAIFYFNPLCLDDLTLRCRSVTLRPIL